MNICSYQEAHPVAEGSDGPGKQGGREECLYSGQYLLRSLYKLSVRITPAIIVTKLNYSHHSPVALEAISK